MKFLEGYDSVARAFHWLMAAMILSLLAVGLYMHDLPREDTLRPTLYMLHKACGMLVLLFFVMRLIWRATHSQPSLSRYGANIRKAAHAAHIALYSLMFGIPTAGYLMSSFHGYPVNFFGLFKLPILVDKDKQLASFFGEVHEYAAYILIAILVLHIAGALKHRFEK